MSGLIRKDVTHKAGKVWINTKNKDLYTGWHKEKVVVNWMAQGQSLKEATTEVDHVVECQLGVRLWSDIDDKRRTTRNRLAPVKEMWNDIANLNNTPRQLNQKKGDAFELWLGGKEDDLRSALLRYNVAANHRTKIGLAFEKASQHLMDELHKLSDVKSVDVYNDMACGLQTWVDKTG